MNEQKSDELVYSDVELVSDWTRLQIVVSDQDRVNHECILLLTLLKGGSTGNVRKK